MTWRMWYPSPDTRPMINFEGLLERRNEDEYELGLWSGVS